jgi:CRP-like cAMP-binding protein
MFVIAEGKVALTSASDTGREISFGDLSAGDIFGEISLFDNQERTATITAIEPTRLLVLSKELFIKFILQNPKTTLKMLAAMAARLRYTDQIYENVMFGPLGVRLARKLLSLAKLFGARSNKSTRITVQLSTEEIAKMLGASLDSVNKQINQLSDNKLISYDQGYFSIIDTTVFSDYLSKAGWG